MPRPFPHCKNSFALAFADIPTYFVFWLLKGHMPAHARRRTTETKISSAHAQSVLDRFYRPPAITRGEHWRISIAFGRAQNSRIKSKKALDPVAQVPLIEITDILSEPFRERPLTCITTKIGEDARAARQWCRSPFFRLKFLTFPDKLQAPERSCTRVSAKKIILERESFLWRDLTTSIGKLKTTLEVIVAAESDLNILDRGICPITFCYQQLTENKNESICPIGTNFPSKHIFDSRVLAEEGPHRMFHRVASCEGNGVGFLCVLFVITDECRNTVSIISPTIVSSTAIRAIPQPSAIRVREPLEQTLVAVFTRLAVAKNVDSF